MPQPVAASGNPGALGEPSDAGHVHEGLHSLQGLLGDVTLAGAGTVSVSTSGQTITITGSGGGGGGGGGVTSLNALTGAITLAGGGDNTISASGQTITVGRAVTTTAPPGVAASSNAGTSGVSANADHTHAGVHSIQSLLADVLLAGAGGITISTSGQTITIDGSGVAGSGGIPTGAILPYGGATAPTGYLMCDGSAVSRTTYSALFAVLGTTYGAGDGSTTFNLPNAQLRFLLGSGANHPLGATGGQLGHTHGPGSYGVGGDTGAPSNTVGAQAFTGGAPVYPGSEDHTHAWGGPVAGYSGPADPPYLVINFIVKT
jgi:microcystin-dependent protein